MRWLLRISQWVRNPPSARMVILVIGVVAACLALWGVEQIWGFPEWLTPNKMHGPSRFPSP